MQALRQIFQHYWKLVRRILSDSAAVSAARAAGITVRGVSVRPLPRAAATSDAESRSATSRISAAREMTVASLGRDWGVSSILQTIQVVRTDTARLEGALRELRPRDRYEPVPLGVLLLS